MSSRADYGSVCLTQANGVTEIRLHTGGGVVIVTGTGDSWCTHP
jgi:hypothetical protein